jgi:hypothetical protein
MTLQEMWREASQRRALVALVLAVAILTGLFVSFRPGLPPESRQYEVWLASGDILVDTSESQVVDAKAPDFLTLASRASLLGNLIATDPLKTAIATAAGVPPNRLVVVPPANATAAGVPATASTAVATVAGRGTPDAEANILTLSTDATLPILRVAAQAPDAATAGRLAGATIDVLERRLDSVAGRENIPAARKLVVRQLGARGPAPETRGPPPLLGLGVAIVVALIGVAAIGGAPILIRRWKQAEQAATENGGRVTGHESTVPFDRTARLGQVHGDGDELEGVAVAAGSGAIEAGPKQSGGRKKQPRRRRKHGKTR